MPTYRVHFASEAHEPFPPLETLPEIEADDPLEAVHLVVESGRYPQDRPIHWARVPLNLHQDGRPKQVLRVMVSPADKIRIDWAPPAIDDAADED